MGRITDLFEAPVWFIVDSLLSPLNGANGWRRSSSSWRWRWRRKTTKYKRKSSSTQWISNFSKSNYNAVPDIMKNASKARKWKF